MPRLKSLFMWAGGKTRLIKYYMPFIPENIDVYYELFLGGGALFAHIHDRINKAVLNDVDSDVMSIYRHIKEFPDLFIKHCKEIETAYLSLPASRDHRNCFPGIIPQTRYEYCDVLRHQFAHMPEFPVNWDSTYRSAVMLFLLKTGFNGVYQVSKKTGYYFTPPGLLNHSNSVFDFDCIRQWNKALQKTTLTSVSWDSVSVQDCSNNFIFLDPPYRGSFTSYGKSFDDVATTKLVNSFFAYDNIKGILSNRDIEDGFFDLPGAVKLPITYTAGRRKKEVDGYSAKKAVEVFIAR